MCTIISLTRYAKWFFPSDCTTCVPTSSVHVIIIPQLCHYFIYQTLKCCPVDIYEMLSCFLFVTSLIIEVKYIIGHLGSFFCEVPIKLLPIYLLDLFLN